MKNKKETERCGLFEEMLMWTSYRYCIGRHTYVISMARDIAKHYYDKLSDKRLEFTASDIRREIADRIKFMPFYFHTEGIYGDAPDCLDLLFTFINKENIQSLDELVKYNSIAYCRNHETNEYNFVATKIDPTIKSYISKSDIDDLIPWMNLANCFDKKSHRMIKDLDGSEIECFKTWVHKLLPAEGKEGWFTASPFGWEEAWVPVESFVKGTANFSYITEDELKTRNNQ